MSQRFAINKIKICIKYISDVYKSIKYRICNKFINFYLTINNLLQNLETQFNNFDKNRRNYIKITSLEFIIKLIKNFNQYIIRFISIIAKFTMFEYDKIH